MPNPSKFREPVIIFIFVLASLVKVVYQLPQRAMFEYDQEYLAASAKSILVDKHLTLIGAPTSAGQMFVGPLYNYVSAAFFWFFQMQPIAISILTALWDPVTVVVTYCIVSNLFNRRIAIFCSLLILGSFSFNFVDFAPPLLHGVPILSLFLIWSIIRTKEGNPRYLFFAALALGLLFQLHFTAILLLFLASLFILLLKPKITMTDMVTALVTFFLCISPLVFFDFRHNWLITQNAWNFFSQQPVSTKMSILEKIWHLLQSAIGEFSFILTFNLFKFAANVIAIGFFIAFLKIIFFLPKSYSRRAYIFFLWIVTFTGLFYFYSGPIVPYYFTPVELPFFILVGIVVDKLWQTKYKPLTVVTLTTYTLLNFYQWQTFNSPLGLAHKIRALEFIKRHSHNQPIYLSHTIEKGLNGGFGYLEWYLKINQKNDQNLPIYTLIVPFNWINAPLDYRTGNIGVIVPKK